MTPGQDTGTLVGRRQERALLEQALRDARTGAGGGAVVLRGDIGIGKTALLRWTAARAAQDGFGVSHVAGDEAERGTAFGALHRLLQPLRESAHALAPHQRAALERAAGLRDGLPAERLMVGAAALALVAAEARRRPVLLLVDDLHWVDPSSAAVFLFLHQRVAELPVAMVCASRPERSALEGWPVHPVEVRALPDEDAGALLRRRHPELAAPAVRRVLDEAAGNPLALAELPGQLAAELRGGPVPLPDRLPLGQRLETLFAHRLRALPGAARQVLLLAALGGTGRHVGPGGAERALALVEASGLACLDAAGRLEFRHPLVRSTVIACASAAERGAAHRLLAEGLRPDDPRRLTHEAAAADGTDASLAARLQEAGTRLALRGGDAEGALLLDRAAALSATPDDRARRLTRAAVMSARGGRLAYAAELVAELRRGPVPRDIAPLFAYAVVYVDQSHHTDFTSTFALLPTALDTLAAAADAAATDTAATDTASGDASPDPSPALGDLLGQMVFKLLLASVYTGDPRGRQALERHQRHLSPAARLCLRAWADPARTAHGAEAELRGLVAGMTDRRETAGAWLLLWAASAVDAADEDLWRLFSDEHTYATRGSVAKARCHQAFQRGRWDAAEECLREADTADGLGYHCNALLFRHYYAHFLAGRGDERGFRVVRARVEPVAARARMRFVTDHLERLEALVAFAHGRHEEAYERLRRVVAPGELPPGQAWSHQLLFDFAAASVCHGRRAEALAHVEAGRAAGMGSVSAHHAFLLAAAVAVTAEDSSADAAYAAAYAVPRAGEWVFDLARLRLLHGTWLGRRGRHAEAAGPLRAAERAFEELRAEPWVRQCGAALLSCERASAQAPGVLTPQELRIARLVSTGLTNNEVGAVLRLSPRTIGAHLYRIYPKLGVTSRAALARALPAEAPSGQSPVPSRARATPARVVMPSLGKIR
ncbi:hypothetical protein SALBM135S_01896 [Streptomyces alboniger]